MKRVIKFRFWHPKIGMSDIVRMGFAHGLRLIPEDIEKGRNDLSDNEWVIMQFTGLLDKNGKPIYEGDVLKIHAGHPQRQKALWYVVFEFGSFQIRTKGEEHPLSFVFFAYDSIKHDVIEEQEELLKFIEVIGNIHEQKTNT